MLKEIVGFSPSLPVAVTPAICFADEDAEESLEFLESEESEELEELEHAANETHMTNEHASAAALDSGRN